MPAKNSINDFLTGIRNKDPRLIGKAISAVENNRDEGIQILEGLDRQLVDNSLTIGITGPPGAGKSTLTSSLIKSLRTRGKRVGILAIDPSSPISGGAVLGDRIRMMSHALDKEVVVRSMASRGKLGGLSASAAGVVRIMAGSGCEYVFIETVGVGQSEMDIVRLADITIMVLAPGFGDDIQAMKAGLLEVADFLVINKADLPGAAALTNSMKQVFAEKEAESSIARVRQTIASDGEGVDSLVDIIDEYDDYLRTNNIKATHRHTAIENETVDLVFEMLQPHIKDMVHKQKMGADIEPRIRAKQITEEILNG